MDNEILTLAAIVAAFVGVAKGYGMPNKHSAAVALAVAAVFVLAPESWQVTLIKISTIGLTAAGAYSYTKNRGGGKG
ncbi:hypothetical protein [Cohnella panacarvi]|uniref:hypothetical protein n=1 Tax=Cohnella panacarvi TaxID=400776 RepID=UPI00047BC9D1|nr:hypothetical protein [Cohnella panacarvi]